MTQRNDNIDFELTFVFSLFIYDDSPIERINLIWICNYPSPTLVDGFGRCGLIADKVGNSDWVHDKYEDDREGMSMSISGDGFCGVDCFLARPSRAPRRQRGDRYSPLPDDRYAFLSQSKFAGGC